VRPWGALVIFEQLRAADAADVLLDGQPEHGPPGA
jgi:hypothetical protein